MAFCSNCGSELPDGVRFCPNCGEKTEDTRSKKQAAVHFVNRILDLFASAPDQTDACDPEDIRDNKVFGILAYLGILVLVPIFAAPKSRYARVHANMGLNLFLLDVILGMVFFSLKAILFPAHFWLGVSSAGYGILNLIQWLLNLLLLAYVVVGIVYAATGRAKELPFINCIKLLK